MGRVGGIEMWGGRGRVEAWGGGEEGRQGARLLRGWSGVAGFERGWGAAGVVGGEGGESVGVRWEAGFVKRDA